MKKRVELSLYCWIISVLSTVMVCGVYVHELKQTGNNLGVCIIGASIIVLYMVALFFMPLSISLDNEELNIRRPLKIKTIKLSNIADAKLCRPTMGAIRICGSGGWFGWYGWFKEQDLGRYFAYYGKASDCFLIILKDGRKYMLGCKDASGIVKAITDLKKGGL